MKEDMVTRLGNRIRLLRTKLGMQQATLAEQAGLSKNYLGKLERGQIPNVSLAIIAGIADALGVKVFELLTNIENEDVSEDDDALANEMYHKMLEDACYPPSIEGVNVSTLLQFLVYLPLIEPERIIDSLLRIDGGFSGQESYVLKQVNNCIGKIPPSPARDYADRCAMRLSRDEHLKDKQDHDSAFEPDDKYEQYNARIKAMETFIKCYRAMVDTGI